MLIIWYFQFLCGTSLHTDVRNELARSCKSDFDWCCYDKNSRNTRHSCLCNRKRSNCRRNRCLYAARLRIRKFFVWKKMPSGESSGGIFRKRFFYVSGFSPFESSSLFGCWSRSSCTAADFFIVRARSQCDCISTRTDSVAIATSIIAIHTGCLCDQFPKRYEIGLCSNKWYTVEPDDCTRGTRTRNLSFLGYRWDYNRFFCASSYNDWKLNCSD